ncbi:MAG: hypothetical protein LC729_02125 [Acidobacteria bacterium]|nr:hypothetical protein [Acidobacteriota bacterium]
MKVGIRRCAELRFDRQGEPFDYSRGYFGKAFEHFQTRGGARAQKRRASLPRVRGAPLGASKCRISPERESACEKTSARSTSR